MTNFAYAQAEACSDLVAKLSTLEARSVPGALLQAEAAGAITYVRDRSGETGIHHGLLVGRGAEGSYPRKPGNQFTFHMGVGFDPTFGIQTFSGKAKLLLAERYDDMGFAIIARNGALQFSNYTWGGGVGNVTSTRCEKVGEIVLPAVLFIAGTSVAQRTMPVVQVDAIRFFPGYGSDSFRLLIKPVIYPVID